MRVIAREPDRHRGLADAGVHVVPADLADPGSLDEPMNGVNAVILVSPAVPAQELNVVASAARSGVAHIVKASSKASADSPIARRRGQTQIEAGLIESGVPHTILRSNAYMQNMLGWAPTIAATSEFGSCAKNGLTGMVDARDVAAVAAAIATDPTSHVGSTHRLTGPALISNYDVVAALSTLLGRTITYRELSFKENKAAMISAGIPEPIAEMNAQAFNLTAQGDAQWLSQDVASILGRPARSFQQFANDYADTFS